MDGRCWRMSSLMKSLTEKGERKEKEADEVSCGIIHPKPRRGPKARFRRGEQGWEQEVDDSEARNTDDFVNGVAETERIECAHAIDCQVNEIEINF